MTPSLKLFWAPATGLAAVLGLLVPATQADILITEIMYDPAGGNEHEYVELYNNGASDIDLTGYQLHDDDDEGSTLSGGTLAAGGTAVLIRVDHARNLTNYQNAWGDDINFIETPNASWLSLPNGGGVVKLKDDSGTLLAEVTYDSNSNGWPDSNDAASIYLTNVNAADPTAAANWALSIAGTDGAYEASAPRIVNGVPDVGSPGFLVPEPASLTLGGLGVLALLGTRRRR